MSTMFSVRLSEEQEVKINSIVNRFIKSARKSSKETAYQDAERKGMDAVRKYCKEQGLPIFGEHLIKAHFSLINM